MGDTIASSPRSQDIRFTRLVRRVQGTDSGPARPRLVLVGLDRPNSFEVLAGLPDLLEREPEPEVEVVLFSLAELVSLIAASAVLVSDDPELVIDAPGLGTPAVLVDGPHVPEPGDSIRSILSPAVMSTARQLLAAGWRVRIACAPDRPTTWRPRGLSRRWRGCSA